MIARNNFKDRGRHGTKGVISNKMMVYEGERKRQEGGASYF